MDSRFIVQIYSVNVFDVVEFLHLMATRRDGRRAKGTAVGS